MPGSQFVGAVPNPYRYPLPEKGPRPSNEVRCADFVAGVRTGGSGQPARPLAERPLHNSKGARPCALLVPFFFSTRCV